MRHRNIIGCQSDQLTITINEMASRFGHEAVTQLVQRKKSFLIQQFQFGQLCFNETPDNQQNKFINTLHEPDYQVRIITKCRDVQLQASQQSELP
jgi:hypothetical protein